MGYCAANLPDLDDYPKKQHDFVINHLHMTVNLINMQCVNFNWRYNQLPVEIGYTKTAV